MPKFPQQWQSRAEKDGRAGSPAGAPDATEADAGGAVLCFDPDTVGRAIVFHMLDEGLAREVASDSVRRMVNRLGRRGLRPSILRSAWEAMTNHERLEWLLSASLTVPLMNPDEDVVCLETRDDA